MTHLLPWSAPVAVAVALLLTSPSSTADTTAPERVVGYGQIKYAGHGPEWWANRSRAWHNATRAWHRKARGLRRVLLARPSVGEAINLACATYGYCSTLWNRARCETGGTFSPGAANPSGASGLFQFMPSTFATTPYGRLSIWSPYANAMAAGWMHAHGRGGEWACPP